MRQTLLCVDSWGHFHCLLPSQNSKALKAKKEEGNKAFKEGNFEAAYELYSEALTIDPNNIKTNAKLYCNRATVGSKVRSRHRRQAVWQKSFSTPPLHPPTALNIRHAETSHSHIFLWQLKKLEQAIEDCTKAIKLDETYIKAYLRRAQWCGDFLA